MYQKFIDGEDISKIPKEQDPFWEDIEDVLIGTANLFLQSLAFALDFDDKLTVTDYKVKICWCLVPSLHLHGILCSTFTGHSSHCIAFYCVKRLHRKTVTQISMMLFSDSIFCNNQGSEEASLVVNVTPCTQTGKALDEDNFVENPTELLDKPYHYKVLLQLLS